MGKTSAGLLVYRKSNEELQVLLVHPGGPLYARKDDGVWSIPKGEFVDGEDPFRVAKREFEEELGIPAGDWTFTQLRPVRQAGGKVVSAWACEGDCEVSSVKSNMFTMEWPPRSKRMQSFPEIDRAAWFTIPEARTKMLAAQVDFLGQLSGLLKA